MIRVLFISNRLPPEGLGGAEAVALSIAEGCSRAGATVAVMGIGGSPVWEGHRPAARGDEIQASKLSWYRLNPTRLSAIQGGEVVPVLKRIAAHIVDLMPTYRRSVAESVIVPIRAAARSISALASGLVRRLMRTEPALAGKFDAVSGVMVNSYF